MTGYEEAKLLAEINEFENKPDTWREIKARCIRERESFLNSEDERKTVPEWKAAEIFDNVMHVISLGVNKIAVYDPERGVYRKDIAYMCEIIGIIEPTYAEAKTKNVIFILSRYDRRQESDGAKSWFKPEYTDKKRFLLVKNGIFDRKMKALKPFSYRFINYSTIETEYDKFAESPVIDGWEINAWLLDLMGGDESLVKLLWQVIAASLNGNYSYRKSIWFVGDGNDGKGTVQQLIANVVGLKNVASLKLNQFAERFALSTIEGKTVIIGDDVQAGLYVDESSNFNSIVTGEPVQIEEKGKAPYTTVFKKTVIQSTNQLPKLKNKSNGTYRRFIIIPFKKTFSAEEDNWKIKDEYIYRTDVLEYVLKKAIEMDFDRFDEPKATLQQLEMFKESNDTVRMFLYEFLDDFVSTRIPTKFFWWLYKEWCKDGGYPSLNKSMFERQLAINMPSHWEKKVSKPVGFKPSEDVPSGYYAFPWDNDKDPKKATRCYIKVT